MTTRSRPGSRILRLPGAIWRRLLHQWALLRAKPLSLERIRSRRPRRLLVICYGNIYRSPFVAACLESGLAGRSGFEIRSAGFHQVPARPSPPEFVRLVRAQRVELGSHRSRIVAPADLEWAEAIVIMDRYNWERLQPFGAAIRAKIVWLGAFSAGPREVEDPYGLPPARVQAVVQQMAAATDGLVRQLLTSGPAAGG